MSTRQCLRSATGFPHLDDGAVDLFEKRVPDLVHELRRAAVLREAVAQGTVGEDSHRAVVVAFAPLTPSAPPAYRLEGR